MARPRHLQTFEDYQRALKDKYGLGEGAGYKPWLRVQDVSSQGSSSKIQGYRIPRIFHTLSKYESYFFLLAEFSNSVIDIREQFPLLPIDLSLRYAQALGVDHPIHPVSRNPIVMTTDFLLTLEDEGGIRYEAVSVKPASKIADKRTGEKLDIERVWWEMMNIPFSIFTLSKQDVITARNIAWLTSEVRQGLEFDDIDLQNAATNIEPGIYTCNEICELLIGCLSVSENQALALFKSLCVYKIIDVDLCHSIISSTGRIEINHVYKDKAAVRYGHRN